MKNFDSPSNGVRNPSSPGSAHHALSSPMALAATMYGVSSFNANPSLTVLTNPDGSIRVPSVTRLIH
ncbi:Uncharacterised protein [Mycobacteroides abscessus subsp. abscessus]|nr:Uncharacterised protein [Mycobacteroides abscessus subsp. abscessus]